MITRQEVIAAGEMAMKPNSLEEIVQRLEGIDYISTQTPETQAFFLLPNYFQDVKFLIDLLHERNLQIKKLLGIIEQYENDLEKLEGDEVPT